MENIKPILIVPSGTMSSDEKIAAQQGGYVVIVCDEPEKIKLITPTGTMDGLDILNAAIIGLHRDSISDRGKKAFVEELYNQIQSKKK